MNKLRHIAFIMDGNSSWAKLNKKPQIDGYRFGMRNLSDIAVKCKELGIEYVSFYAFSSENWERPASWIKEFMNLAKFFIQNDSSLKKLEKEQAKLILLGNIDKLDPDLRKLFENLVEKSKNNNGIKICLAISYGGRDEIVRACKKLASFGAEITEQAISENLDTSGIPDPDLLIRTSGNQRLSNFFLWQLSYSELYFSKKYWPDFDENELKVAIDDFYLRERKYGK